MPNIQVRKYPKLMLCLQNGRFDHPDRMFNRVEDAFRNCLVNMSDFKVHLEWKSRLFSFFKFCFVLGIDTGILRYRW